MLGKRFFPFIYAENFYGVNSKDSDENMLPGEWKEESIDIFSDPQGALGSRPGYTALTTASISTTTAWCGFYQFDIHSGGTTTAHYIGGCDNGKLYKYASSKYEEIYTGLDTTDDDDARFSFFTLDNICIICNGRDAAIKYSGTGSAATFATSITADFGLEWHRRGWLHSTVDPRLMYYCTTLGDPDSAYTSFLNFDEDNGAVTGACKQGDDMLVGKAFSLFRVQYRGTTPLFVKYRIPSKVGPISHFTMKELPDGSVIFLAPDFNFHRIKGDSIISVGDNIRKVIKDGVHARLKYAVSGLLYNRSQYWCSFTYTSGVTTNDRTVVMDWSRPYLDKWKKIQFPWFIYSIAANCFAEITLSGKSWLYHGDYAGLIHKDDTGTNDNGSAFANSYHSPIRSHGDGSLEKKYDYLALAYQRKGDWDLTIQIICDGNAATEKLISESMTGGLGYLSYFDQAKFDEDYFSSESDLDTTRDIGRQGKRIQLIMGTDGLDEAWNIYLYTIHAKPLRRGRRTRESS